MLQLIDILACGVTDNAGAVLASGKVTFYKAGSSTLQTVYQDYTAHTPHPNPATLDSYGRLFAYSDQNLKLAISKSDGVAVRVLDNIIYNTSELTQSELSQNQVKAQDLADTTSEGLNQSSGAWYVDTDDLSLETFADILRVKQPFSEVKLTTGNGYGSGGTKIRCFSTVTTNVGEDLTITQSATDGDMVTVETDGLYAIAVRDVFPNLTDEIGISLNASSLTTNVTSLTSSERLAHQGVPGTTALQAQCQVFRFLEEDDIIRFHTNAGSNSTSALVMLHVLKIRGGATS